MAESLADAAAGGLLLAIPVAALAGLVSFFSPCVLPLLPGYLSYVTGIGVQDLQTAGRGRMLAGSVLFVLGFTVVFVLGGALFGAMGSSLVQYRRQFSVGLGLIVIVMGLVFMGYVPSLQREVRIHAVPAVGVAIAPVLGFFFGLGWLPCIGPTLAVVLTLANQEGTAARGALLTVVYCLALGIPFVIAALAFRKFARATDWAKQHQRGIQRFGGAMLVVVGVLLVSGIWDGLVVRLQVWASQYGTVI